MIWERIAFGQAEASGIPDAEIAGALLRMMKDRKDPDYADNTLFQDKLLWIARGYASQGIRYTEISDTTLVKKDGAAGMLAQVHSVMPAIYRETGVRIRFLAAIRRIPLTIRKGRESAAIISPIRPLTWSCTERSSRNPQAPTGI